MRAVTEAGVVDAELSQLAAAVREVSARTWAHDGGTVTSVVVTVVWVG